MCVTAGVAWGEMADPFAYVRTELAKGAKEIRVPKALYEVAPAPDQKVYLSLKGVSDHVIDFGGSELRGLVKTRVFELANCTNVTIRNLTIDFKELPFTQAEILDVDKDRNWNVKILSGYPVPGDGAVWPVQVYDRKTLELKNAMRMGGDVKVVKTGPDVFRITGGGNRTGDKGDYVVWGVPERGRPYQKDAIYSSDSARCTFENIVEYATPMGRGFEEWRCDGLTYRGCVLDRRPPEADFAPRAVKRLRSGNHDAFWCIMDVKGPKILNCTTKYHCDDCINITGMYAILLERKGNVLRLAQAPYGSPIATGDVVYGMTQDGRLLPDAQVLAAADAGALTPAERDWMDTLGLWPGFARRCERALTLTLSDASTLERGAALISKRAEGRGFEIRNCTLGHNRAFGIRLRASDGVIEGNTIERTEGPSVYVGPEYEWMEGGLTRNVVFKNNICDRGVVVQGSAAHRKPLPEGSRPELIRPMNWDKALIRGTTPQGRLFFEPGEEMVFTLKLEGAEGTLTPDTYFVDWERRGDDGVTQRGRAPLPFPKDGLVLRTKSDKPGFVCIEANVVTKDGKRVPKNHRWEKRVFFQGGAGVRPDEIPMADEPADYDAFWAACLKELAAVPMNAQLTPVACKDAAVKLYAVRIPCAGPQPVTGYLTIPTAASATNRMPITAAYRGASQDEQLPPSGGPHDRISMLINPNGYELGKGPEYVKQFFKDVSQPGYGYGMGPKQNEHKETSYWKWCALRAIRYLQWIKTLPEWDGKELVLGGGSQGDWQCYHAAAHVPGVTRINANGSWGCDWTGQNQFKRLRSTYRPGCWYPDMAYFDPVFAAKRITCPVNISFSGLGDYCSTPASLTLVYRNLKGPKSITYVQGSTHGWRPSGEQTFTRDGGWKRSQEPKSNPSAATALLASPDIVYHLDASRADTLVRDAQGRVTKWTSANGNGYAFTAETATAPTAAEKINGKTVVSFNADAKNNLVGSGTVEHRTVFVVCRPRRLRPFMGVWGPKGQEGGLRTEQGSAAWENACVEGKRGGPNFNSAQALLADGRAHAGGAGFTLGTVQILALRHPEDTMFWNAASRATFTPAVGHYLPGRPFDGDVAEVIAFRRLLSEADCRNVSAALALKWRGGVMDEIRAQIAEGAKTVTLPKGQYRLAFGGGDAYLSLSGLTGVTVDFGGSELIGDVVETMISLQACTNVTVRNAVIDYDPLPFTQAVITKVDADRNWDVKVIDGYPRPTEKECADDEMFWPVQAYDKRTLELKNPMRFRKEIAIRRTGADTYRITGGLDRRGEEGDIAVWSIRDPRAPHSGSTVSVGFCQGCRFENLTVYSTPRGCAYAEGSADGNVYRNCSVVRRPPETDLAPRALKRLRSGNHDAFNSRCSYRGPTLENCTFQYHCDDCVNISGFYAFVTEQKGRTIRLAPSGGRLRIDAGDTCQVMTFGGTCPPDVKVVSIAPAGPTTEEERKLFESYNLWPGIARGVRLAFTATLDADVELPPGSVIISNRRMGNGFRIRNCTMGHNRARGLLIKASDGVIENNTLEGVEGFAVQITPEYEWMEGGCSRNMVVRNNTLRGNGGGVYLAGNNGARKPLPADSHRNVAITGNVITNSPLGIAVVGCTGLTVTGNDIRLHNPKEKTVQLTNVDRADVR